MLPLKLERSLLLITLFVATMSGIPFVCLTKIFGAVSWQIEGAILLSVSFIAAAASVIFMFMGPVPIVYKPSDENLL